MERAARLKLCSVNKSALDYWINGSQRSVIESEQEGKTAQVQVAVVSSRERFDTASKLIIWIFEECVGLALGFMFTCVPRLNFKAQSADTECTVAQNRGAVLQAKLDLGGYQ